MPPPKGTVLTERSTSVASGPDIVFQILKFQLNPDKAGLFESSFPCGAGQLDPLSIFQEELI